MLTECHIARRRLATPTMGRLIERFVEAQLGSHSDRMRADYETKMQFLTSLGGRRLSEFRASTFRRRLARYLTMHGHPHSPAEFEEDLMESGLLEPDVTRGVVRWTRPIFREFFWVRNLVRENKHRVLSQELLGRGAQSVAAIIGSQMGNAQQVLGVVLDELSKMPWMQNEKLTQAAAGRPPYSDVLPDDAAEDALLQMIEVEASGGTPPARATEPQAPESSRQPSELAQKGRDEAFTVFAERQVAERHHLVGAISALLLNARALPVDYKTRAVVCVLRSNSCMVRNLVEAFRVAREPKPLPAVLGPLVRYFGLVLGEMMLGDAFLAEIFRQVAKATVAFEERLALQDLLVSCDSASPSTYADILRTEKHPDAVVSVYLRLVEMYFYRFHKAEQKVELRAAMKEVRKLAKGFALPPVPA